MFCPLRREIAIPREGCRDLEALAKGCIPCQHGGKEFGFNLRLLKPLSKRPERGAIIEVAANYDGSHLPITLVFINELPGASLSH